MIELGLILACAPGVHPSIIKEIVRVESAGNPLGLNINTRNGIRLRPRIKITTPEHAVAVAGAATDLGHTVDLGYMQVNSANLPRLGYTVEDMFNPCKNLAAGAKVFTEFYVSALSKYKNEQMAIRAALSAYNTGSFQRGFQNGYVSRYLTRQ